MGSDADSAKGSSKRSKFAIRTVSTVTLIMLFIAIMWAGHIPCAMLLFAFQTMIVKELFTLARNIEAQSSEGAGQQLRRTKQWSFFLVATFYLYGRFIRGNFAVTFMGSSTRVGTIVAWVLSRHLLISYTLYTLVLCLFVITLQPDMYKQQFRQLGWTHLIVFFTVLPSSFFVPLIFQGLAWFLLPAALVMVNDIMAYLAGVKFGKTPLIRVSPKKTVEGFIGGAIGTMAASFLLIWVFAQFKWLYCPRSELTMGPLDCETPPAFVRTTYFLSDMVYLLPDFVVEDLQPLLGLIPKAVRGAFGGVSWTCMPAQMHAIALAAFASLIGPFGGFFASGFKRALGVKDFGDSIPGHGGITDRFDCQMPMAVFSYIYYSIYIAQDQASEEVLQGLMDMQTASKLRVFAALGSMLVAEGALDQGAWQYALQHTSRAAGALGAD